MLGKRSISLIPFMLAIALSVCVILWVQKNPDIPVPDDNTHLIEQLDSLKAAHAKEAKLRTAAYDRIDSLVADHKADSVLLTQKDKEILKLRGKYRNIPTSEKGKLMDHRADSVLNAVAH